MCGIVGMAGDLEFGDRQVFRDLLDVCQVRGRDSTGVININRQKAYGYFKSVGPPTYMFDRRGYEDTIETGTHAAFIGHCRHKTSGAVNVANAHPFEFEEQGIIGVHNGTLRNYHHLDGHTHQKVDSEVLYNHLAQNGPEETFNNIEGAWACVWWNDQNETLNFIRNDERPLWFCWSENRRKMYWASSVWMLQAIEYDGRRVKMWKGPKDDYEGKYIQLPVDTLWSFNLEPNAKKGDPTVTMRPSKKIERKKPPVVVTPPRSTVGNVLSSSSGGSSRDKETALSVWNMKSTRTHGWDQETRKLVPKMTFEEWETEFNKKNGGSVPNPFQQLDDQLPVHLRPKQETLALIQGGKSGTTPSTPSSSTPSKSGSEPGKPPNSTANGPKSTDSPGQQSLTDSQKTDRKKLTARLPNLQQGNGGYTPKHVSFRWLAGMTFITDSATGTEYSEAQVQTNTEGVCSFCDEPIGDLTEIHKFYSSEKFICTHCTEPSLRSVA